MCFLWMLTVFFDLWSDKKRSKSSSVTPMSTRILNLASSNVQIAANECIFNKMMLLAYLNILENLSYKTIVSVKLFTLFTCVVLHEDLENVCFFYMPS